MNKNHNYLFIADMEVPLDMIMQFIILRILQFRDSLRRFIIFTKLFTAISSRYQWWNKRTLKNINKNLINHPNYNITSLFTLF